MHESLNFFQVSEELSSVETISTRLYILEMHEFQKNLVVWKHCSWNSFQATHIKVSEELSSVETYISSFSLSCFIIVSEELSSVETK